MCYRKSCHAFDCATGSVYWRVVVADLDFSTSAASVQQDTASGHAIKMDFLDFLLQNSQPRLSKKVLCRGMQLAHDSEITMSHEDFMLAVISQTRQLRTNSSMANAWRPPEPEVSKSTTEESRRNIRKPWFHLPKSSSRQPQGSNHIYHEEPHIFALAKTLLSGHLSRLGRSRSDGTSVG